MLNETVISQPLGVRAAHIFFFGLESVAGAAGADPSFTPGISGDGTAIGSGTSVLSISSSSASSIVICLTRGKGNIILGITRITFPKSYL